MRAWLIVCVVAAVSHVEASPDPGQEIPAFALSGPFPSRGEACEEALGSRGNCVTYRTAATLPAKGDWQAIEIGAIGDRRADNTATRHYGLFVRIGKQWFAEFLGTNGTIDTEYFPPCNGGENCTPFHRMAPAHYAVPKLSLLDAVKGGAPEIVMFYPTPADVGFRDFAPKAELVQVCGMSDARAPSCTGKLIALTRNGAAMRSPADLFSGTDGMTPYGDEPLADGKYHSYAGHLKFH